MRNIKYQLIKFTVNSSGEKVRIAFDTNNLYEKVSGIFMSMPTENCHKNSCFEMQMNGEEIFPAGFETKFLATNQSVSPNERFFSLQEENIPAKGNHAEAMFTDGGFSVDYPYDGIIYLKLTNTKTA